jgi:NAD(P)-dependent dehydrogenase (short-subunit alcohol dehydrogenase family)
MDIKDRVALVTGAGSGIGQAVAFELASRGAKTVVIVDRRDEVFRLADSLNSELGRLVAEAKVGDATNDTFRSQVYDQVTARHGVVTICIPAAGITRDALAVSVDKTSGRANPYSITAFREVMEVNLVAPVFWAIEMVVRIAEDRVQRGLKQWQPEEEVQGAVVFIGSVSSRGNKGQIAYAVSKAGLEGAAATLTKEAMYHGVRCGIIHPGYTDTPMVRKLGEEFIGKNILPYTQLRRLIRPTEIADAICFMVCNPAVSGELWADAGWHPPA